MYCKDAKSSAATLWKFHKLEFLKQVRKTEDLEQMLKTTNLENDKLLKCTIGIFKSILLTAMCKSINNSNIDLQKYSKRTEAEIYR